MGETIAVDETEAERRPRRAWIALALVVIAFAAFALLLNPNGTPSAGVSEWLAMTAMGGICAQPLLLATWAALGPGGFVKRGPWTVVVQVALSLAGSVKCLNVFAGFASLVRIDVDEIVAMFSLFGVMTAAMLVVRRITGWRIAASAGRRDGAVQPNQFSVKGLMVLTAVSAVLLAAGRIVVPGQLSPHLPSSSDAMRIAAMVGLLAVAFLPVLFLPLLVLSSRVEVSLVAVLVCAWALLTWLAASTIAVLDGPPVGGTRRTVMLLQLGIAVAGIVSALALRWGGYRLGRQTTWKQPSVPQPESRRVSRELVVSRRRSVAVEQRRDKPAG